MGRTSRQAGDVTVVARSRGEDVPGWISTSAGEVSEAASRCNTILSHAGIDAGPLPDGSCPTPTCTAPAPRGFSGFLFPREAAMLQPRPPAAARVGRLNAIQEAPCPPPSPSPLTEQLRINWPFDIGGFCQGRFARVPLTGGDARPFQRPDSRPQLSLQTPPQQRPALHPQGQLNKQSSSLLTIKNAFNPSPPAILIFFFKHSCTQFSKIGLCVPQHTLVWFLHRLL